MSADAVCRQGARQDRGLTLRTVARAAERLGIDEQAKSETGDNSGLAGGFPANRLFLQAAAAYGIVAEFMPASEQPPAIARAMLSINRSLETGFKDTNYLRNDPDLAPLQKHDAFQSRISAVTVLM